MLSLLRKLLGFSTDTPATQSSRAAAMPTRQAEQTTRDNSNTNSHHFDKAREDKASRIAGRMIEDEPSFSLVFIPGDASAHMGPLMDGLGYAPKRGTRMQASFADVWDFLLDTPSHEPDVVRKAWYRTDKHTVLIDPEMATHLQLDVWKQLAAIQGGTVVMVIWERMSRTVLLAEVSDAGLVRRTSRVDDDPITTEEVNPHPEVVASADADGLRPALASMGILVDAGWNSMLAEVIEMQPK
jgi:hypothetical protein